MERLRHYPIKKKMMAISLLTTGFALLLFGLLMTASEFIRYRRSMFDILTVQAQMIVSNSAAALTFNDQRAAEEVLSAFNATPNIIQAVIFTQDGKVFARYRESAHEGEEAEGRFPVLDGGEHREFKWDHLDLTYPITLDGERIGLLYLESDLSELYSRLGWYTATGLFSMTAAFLLTLLILARVQKSITVPILALSRVMREVSEGRDYSVRAGVTGTDELGQLAEGFNGMLAQIQARDQELEGHRHQLEEKVSLRTAELAEANNQLQVELMERWKAEEMLRRKAEELRQTNEELKNFAYTISHDLRAPLVNIKGFSGELSMSLKTLGEIIGGVGSGLEDRDKTELAEIINNDVPEALEFISSSVQRMDNLIGAILKLSRLGRKELVLEPVDVEELARAILKTLAHQLEERRVHARVGTLPQVVADRTAIEQILGNLLDNAVKYLEADRDGDIEISAEELDEATVFHVRDNGRGIAKDDVHKVFELFRRVGRQDVAGEGMGLAYVVTLVRRHEGRIWCESEPGAGSCFSFTISRGLTPGESLPS